MRQERIPGGKASDVLGLWSIHLIHLIHLILILTSIHLLSSIIAYSFREPLFREEQGVLFSIHSRNRLTLLYL